MDIREVIKMVNQMQADGVIERYAVGGAVGATFYLEPVATLDVDIFIAFQPEEGSLIVIPKPILDYLKARGGTMEGEYVVIGGWPVQFLPPAGPLGEEALAQAVESDVDGTPTRVFTAEHLARSRPDGPRTRPGSSSSSRPARWTPRASRPSSSGTASLTPGKSLNDNFFVTHHDLRPAKDPRK